MKEIYILGIGHNTPVIMELAELCGYSIVGLYHFDASMNGTLFYDIPVLGSYDDLFKKETLTDLCFALSMGNNQIRKNLFERILSHNGNIPTLIHPTASISKYAKIEEGVIVQSQAVIQAGAIIHNNSVISFNVGITHNVEINKHCYIAGQTIISAYTNSMEGAFIGMGVTTLSAKVPEIGSWYTIGGGSVVTKSVAANQTVCGNPAKPINK